MDIYNYAEKVNYKADYYEWQTGYIYHIQDYGKSLSFAAARDVFSKCGDVVKDGERIMNEHPDIAEHIRLFILAKLKEAASKAIIELNKFAPGDNKAGMDDNKLYVSIMDLETLNEIADRAADGILVTCDGQIIGYAKKRGE